MKILFTSLICLLSLVLGAQTLKPFKSDRDKWGYKDAGGNVIISARYEYAWDFDGGLALVKNKKSKYGFIDETGKEIIPLIYESASYFKEGLALVRLEYKYGYIDKTGAISIALKYDDAGSFSHGLARVRFGAVREGKYNTLKGGKWGFIDKTGKEVIPLMYDYAGDFSEGLAYVGLNRKYGFVDRTGKAVVPLRYDDAGNFSEGLAKVRRGDYFDGKWGYVDSSGELVIPVQFEEAGDFYKGEARVKLNGKSIYIDKSGTNEEGRKQKAAEEAERIKKERQAVIDKAIAQSRRDTLARQVLNLYLAEDPKLLEKIRDLQSNVESTMVFDPKYGFNKKNWIFMSSYIEGKVKLAREQIEAFKNQLKPFENIRNKNELYQRITINLEKVSAFVSSCSAWATYIHTLGEYDDGISTFNLVADNLSALKRHDDALRAFIALYSQRNGL